MGLLRKKKPEIRADTGTVSYEDSLLQALLGSTSVTKTIAIQIPTVASAISLVGSIVASTPVKLYKESDGETEEVGNDPRTALLNDETGDTLSANEFWRAIVQDYYLGKGGYAYINKQRNKLKSIHYVDEAKIVIQTNTDPIFKNYDILIDGAMYKPYDFLKILRNSKDGASGTAIISENSKVLEVAYESLVFESALVKKGGNKKGFITSESKLGDAEMTALKSSYKNLYSNNEENVLVLNKGIDFHESSNTSVELQLNENKKTNAEEIAKIFHMSPALISGSATETEVSSFAKLAIIPLLKTIECALNRDLLLEKEKGSYYFAFDTKELLKGSLLDRYKAYEIAAKNGWKTRNEIRFLEDDPALDGMDVISMSLADVIYDPKTKTYFTPNMNAVTNTNKPLEGGGAEDESGNQS
jgi:HK97 family phage portal protein